MATDMPDKIDDKEMLCILRAILNKNSEDLSKALYWADHCEVINEIKNNPEALEWFLYELNEERIVNKWNYSIWTGVCDVRTFNLYKIHGVEPSGLSSSEVTPEQWEYLRKIHLIPENYCLDCVELCSISNDAMITCQRCIQAEAEEEQKMRPGHADLFEVGMEVEITQDDSGGWFFNGIPVVLYCSGCISPVLTMGECENCRAEKQITQSVGTVSSD